MEGKREGGMGREIDGGKEREEEEERKGRRKGERVKGRGGWEGGRE